MPEDAPVSDHHRWSVSDLWGSGGPRPLPDNRQLCADDLVRAAPADRGEHAPRPGLPESLTEEGRVRAHAERGLYVHGTGNPALRPQVPDEPDAFDAPPLPWTRVRRPGAGR